MVKSDTVVFVAVCTSIKKHEMPLFIREGCGGGGDAQDC